MDPTLNKVSEAILNLIRQTPMKSFDVQKELAHQGFSSEEVRRAIAILWDNGFLNVGLDQKLRIPDDEGCCGRGCLGCEEFGE